MLPVSSELYSQPVVLETFPLFLPNKPHPDKVAANSNMNKVFNFIIFIFQFTFQNVTNITNLFNSYCFAFLKNFVVVASALTSDNSEGFDNSNLLASFAAINIYIRRFISDFTSDLYEVLYTPIIYCISWIHFG